LIYLSLFSNYLFRLFWALNQRDSYFRNLFRLLKFFTSHPTKYSAEIFAEAIEDHYSNKMKSKFLLYQHCFQKDYNGFKEEYNIGIYFRKWGSLYSFEKKLINLAYGKILDVGSNTGYYMPYLMKQGNVTGIEISQRINNISTKNGFYNSIVGDFFKYKFNNKFDTITLIGNDVALSGTLYRLKKLLKKLFNLLNKNGQVLLLIRHIRSLRYWHVIYTPRYKGKFGISAKYLFLNTHFFIKLSEKYGFKAEILSRHPTTGNPYYLVRLIKPF